MSFGWSASDVAMAINTVLKIIKALDGSKGAAKDYRETTAFLRSLIHTLEPLQSSTAFEA